MPPRLPPSVSEARPLRSVADEHRLASHARGSQEDPGDQLVAAPEDADQDRHEQRTDDVEPECGEALAGPDRERKRERSDEKDARDDTCRGLPRLARFVQTGLPEDEDLQQDQKGEPVGLVIPEQPPEDRLRVDDRRAKGERCVEADHESGDVDRREHEHARDAATERLQR